MENEVAKVKGDYTSLLRTALTAYGDEVGMDSPECASYRGLHENCGGCRYELGCSKLVGLQLLGFSEPKHLAVKAILKAKTVEEVLAVVDTYGPQQENYLE